ncbi:DUF4163 domain-containing protein [Paenibacillus sp. PsM32]|uniref:PdaC/SigV domain-containing protein n=1 Tax=Paenibacillus sp. PsM32 TaxID=3030536 RepID=UPI00263B760F|nr:DUF4163 domain-containing protein [Paenibacillus sp. PsM32]MDN4619044.1 DUF4163 domain-containing protein [Paenibacillus sp. PsM32]
MNTNQNNTSKAHLKKISAFLLATTMATVGTVAVLPGTSYTVQAAAATSSTAKSAIHVQVEGKAIATTGIVSPNGSSLLPLKDTAKAIGATVTYNAKEKTVTVTKDKNKASFALGADVNDGVFVTLNGSTVGDSYDAKIVNGTSYVAIKAVTDQFGYRAVWNGATRTVNITKEGMNNIELTTATLKPTKTNSYTEINIKYPVISGLDNSEAEVAINKAFKAHAQTYLEQTQKQAKELGAPPKDSAMTYEIDSGYKVTYNRNGVLSVLVNDYEFLGGAHGGATLTGMTFSLKDGKQIQLSDLLKSNSNYRKDIDKVINAEIKKEDLYFADSFKGIAANQGYYLTDSGLTIYFQQYEIAPYAAGTPEFSFTFKKLLPTGVNPLDAYKA